MKILMMSKNGDGFGLAQKLQEEGHDIRVWVQSKGYEFVLQGLVEQVSSWRPSASDWADFVLADMVGFGRFATALDSFNVDHLGFNQIADMAELDRAKQMQLFRKFNIDIPDTEEFENPKAAEAILDDWIAPGYVIKPSGNLNTGKTFIIRDQSIYRWALEQFAGDQDLIVQRIVEGVEISTEGWFNGRNWVKSFNHTIEYKSLFPDGVGPLTGCMGNVVWVVNKPNKDVFVLALKKLTPFLKAADYKGPIDLNTIATSAGIFALELTVRFGYDAIEALYELMDKKDLGNDLLSLSKGELNDLSVRKNEFGLVVRLSIPPYPHRQADSRDRGMPIIIPRDFDHIYLTDVYHNSGEYRWAASDGVLMKVGGSGKNVAEAQRAAKTIYNRIHAPGLQYRSDIGDSVGSDISRLKAWGYLQNDSLLKRMVS